MQTYKKQQKNRYQ